MISVITPSFGYARFLTSALYSVESSGCGAQHVVMDGGSTDGSIEILRAWDRPEFEWRSEPDAGQSDALNKALTLATGEIIGWLNADEFYLPGVLSKVEEVFQRSPDVDVVHGDVVFVDADGRFIRLLAGTPFAARLLPLRGCTVASAGAFVRRSALGDAPFDVQLKTVMDWDLFLGLRARRSRFHYIRFPMACFRLHESQVTAGGIDRDSSEHEMLRQRHAAPVGMLAWRRALGDGLHAGAKVLCGSAQRERRATRLSGLGLLDGDRVSEANFARLIALYTAST